MSSWSPTKYKTRNWPSYNTALKQRGSLSIWFDPEMSWHAPPTGKRGRQPAFNDAAIQVCLTMKVLFGMPFARRLASLKACCGWPGWTGKFQTSALYGVTALKWHYCPVRANEWRTYAASRRLFFRSGLRRSGLNGEFMFHR